MITQLPPECSGYTVFGYTVFPGIWLIFGWYRFSYTYFFWIYELISALRADINSIRGLRPLIIPWFGWPTANKHDTGVGADSGTGAECRARAVSRAGAESRAVADFGGGAGSLFKKCPSFYYDPLRLHSSEQANVVHRLGQPPKPPLVTLTMLP